MQEQRTSYFKAHIFPQISTFNYDLEINDYESSVEGICLGANATNISNLSKYKNIDTIICWRITTKQIAQFPIMPSVKHLGIDGCDASSLDFLKKFPNLVYLQIENFKKLESTLGIEVLTKLKYLTLGSNLNLKEFQYVSNLEELISFELVGSSHRILKMRKLSTLGVLSKIQELKLDNVSPPKGDYTHLLNFKSLKKLALPNNTKLEQFAFLNGALPNTDCYDFVPYQPFILDRFDNVISCKGCGAEMIKLTGKGKQRIICKDCDKEILESHINIYNEWKHKGEQTLKKN